MSNTIENQTVLVTGALGQVGKRVTQILLDRGRTVIALDLPGDGNARLIDSFRPGAGTLVPAFVDLLDAAAVHGLVSTHQPGAIIHLAAIVSPPAYRNPRLARRVNVDGTANLIAAALALPSPPLFVAASSAAVYGSRNPHTHRDRLTAETPVNPVDCYGEDKVAAERAVAGSGLPHAVLRLGGVISPDILRNNGPDYGVFLRAIPNDNRIHAVDARDVALAFANTVDSGPLIDGKILLIGGNETYVNVQHMLEDDIMAAVGVGRLGTAVSLPGDPNDDNRWALTDWFDTTEAQELLDFQKHSWPDTLAWLAESLGPRRAVIRLLSPAIRPLLRLSRRLKNRREKCGRYADPWRLIGGTYGKEVLAPTDW